METTKIKEAIKCTVYTMSEACFKQIDNYLRNFPEIVGETIEATKNNIMKLKYFESGCFTYIQAQAFAEYYHAI